MAKNDWMYAIGALGAAASGYAKGKRQYEDYQYERERREREKEERALQIEALRRNNERARKADEAAEALLGTDLADAGGVSSAESDYRYSDLRSPADGGVSLPRAAIPRRGGRRARLEAEYAWAVRRGDAKALPALRGEMERADQDEIFNAAASAFSPDSPEADQLMKMVNTNSVTTTISPHTDTNGRPTGYWQLTVVRPDGTAATKYLSQPQLRTLAGAAALMKQGHMQRGLEFVKQVDVDFATALARETQLNQQATQANNQATHYANQDRLREREVASRENADRLGRVIEGYGVNEDGTLKPEFYALSAGRRGIAFNRVPLPDGFVPGSALNPQAIGRAVQSLVGQPTGRRDKTGAEELHTEETARQAVMGSIVRQFSNRGNTGLGVPVPPAPPRAAAIAPGRTPAGPPTSSGQSKFGVLTPQSVLEREVAAGNPAAIQYVRERDRARAADEEYRGVPGFGMM